MNKAEIKRIRKIARKHYDSGRFNKAHDMFSQLKSVAPDASSCLYLARTKAHLGHRNDAEQLYLEAIRYDQASSEAHLGLGIIQAQLGKYQQAVAVLQKALVIDPDNVEACSELGNIYYRHGRIDEAEEWYQRALNIHPENVTNLNNMGNIRLQRSRYDEAISYYERALDIDNNFLDAVFNLGSSHHSRGDYDRAIEYYQRARQIAPSNNRPIAAIAQLYENRGDNDKANAILKPYIDGGAADAEITRLYAKCLQNEGSYAEGISLLEAYLFSHDTQPQEKQALYFALGNLCDRNREYDKAFGYYQKANDLLPFSYDPENTRTYFQRLIDVADTEPDNRNIDSSYEISPLFIVGMPRSGTTLVEQILSSHSEVYGAGELPFIAELSNRLAGEHRSPYPECLNEASRESIRVLAENYIDRIDELSDGSPLLTDKMPHNFIFIDLIMRMFPGTKVIHCLRDPLDVCLSIYFHNFNTNHPYTDQLHNLGFYYNAYRELMKFWQERYPDNLIELRYEDLITSSESTVKRMLHELGMTFEDTCMKFHENRRDVATPSYDQVRKPLYNSSMKRWSNYRQHIDELVHAIDDEYLEPDI